MFVEHVAAEARGNGVDELIAAQDAANVGIVEDVLGSGQAQSRSGDRHRKVGGSGFLAVVNLAAAIENIGEHVAEFGVAIAVHRAEVAGQRPQPCRRNRLRLFPTARKPQARILLSTRQSFRSAAAQSCRVKTAQRLVEGGDIADLRMIGEQRNDVAAFAEHILGKSLQRFLRPNFDEDARTRVVERAQTLYELHGRSHLLGENVQHLRHNIRPGWDKTRR